MTNFERWLSYTSGLPSPQNYIEWSWRYLIGAALQRRVWIGSPHQKESEEHQPCFANSYVILVGNPGTGKGLPIREVSNFLKFWKLKDAIKIAENLTNQQQKETAATVAADDLKMAKDHELQTRNKQNNIVEPLLIPVAADATTYEALVEAVANSYRRVNYISKDKDGNPKLGIYGHSSICFSLQELASLLRKRTDDTVNYMLGLYDCPVDYEYSTKTQGKDRVRRGCLNLLAGTTPGFMQSIFNDELIDEGFSSRSFFIYANKKRFSTFFIAPLTPEQIEHRIQLLDHIRNLTALYGNVKIDPETYEFLAKWWDDYEKDMHKRVNNSPKLLPYYARKNIHVMKVAMQEHFSESLDLHIPLDTFKKAIEILAEEEKNMHLAITLEGKNPLSNISRKVLELLEAEPKNFVDLHVDTFSIADKKQLEDALTFLIETGQVEPEPRVDETTDTSVNYFKLKGRK